MVSNRKIKTLIFLTAIFSPCAVFGQGFAGEIHSLQSVLDQLYQEMLPLCSQLIGVARGLAGFAALWYIGARIWRHLANAEPIDFYPLLRPFALGLCIMLFPYVIAVMNGVLSPTVAGTAAMVNGSNNSIAYLLKLKEEAITKTPAWQMYVGIDGNGDREKWLRYSRPAGEEQGMFDGIGEDLKFSMAKASYNFKNSIKQWLSELLHIFYEAAALCINTIRTFYLIVLAVLGPLVFGFANFDGFQHTLRVWISRYVSVFLWLPVANIFGAIIGKIQENMLKIDIEQVNKYGDTFFNSTDTAYLIFLVIAIVGYFTVPSVANYIVHAGGGGNYLMYKATNLFTGSAHSALNTTANAVGAGGTAAYNVAREKYGNVTGTGQSSGSDNSYQRDKLSGKA